MYDHVAIRRHFRDCLKPNPEITPYTVEDTGDGRHHLWSDGTAIVRLHHRSPAYAHLPAHFRWPGYLEAVTVKYSRSTEPSLARPLHTTLNGYLALPGAPLVVTPATFEQDYRPAVRLLLGARGERIWIQERYYRWLGKTPEERRRVRFTLHGDAVIGRYLGEVVLLVMRNLATTAPGYDLWDDLRDLMAMKAGVYVLTPEPDADEPVGEVDRLVAEMVVRS